MQKEEGDGKMLLDPQRDADRACVCVCVCETPTGGSSQQSHLHGQIVRINNLN